MTAHTSDSANWKTLCALKFFCVVYIVLYCCCQGLLNVSSASRRTSSETEEWIWVRRLYCLSSAATSALWLCTSPATTSPLHCHRHSHVTASLSITGNQEQFHIMNHDHCQLQRYWKNCTAEHIQTTQLNNSATLRRMSRSIKVDQIITHNYRSQCVKLRQ